VYLWATISIFKIMLITEGLNRLVRDYITYGKSYVT